MSLLDKKSNIKTDAIFSNKKDIELYDAELWESFKKEMVRQEEHIELIASENYASPRTMEAQGSVLTNKYAEGYPGKRYYGGCEHVDKAEVLAVERAKTLFGADFANVQPHSGSQANAAVYLALLEGGDTVLGMSLADGGHLTHGATVNFSGKLYNPGTAGEEWAQDYPLGVGGKIEEEWLTNRFDWLNKDQQILMMF